jgi:hypothetical protein
VNLPLDTDAEKAQRLLDDARQAFQIGEPAVCLKVLQALDPYSVQLESQELLEAVTLAASSVQLLIEKRQEG